MRCKDNTFISSLQIFRKENNQAINIKDKIKVHREVPRLVLFGLYICLINQTYICVGWAKEKPLSVLEHTFDFCRTYKDVCRSNQRVRILQPRQDVKPPEFHSLAAGLPERERNFGEIWAIHDMNGAIVFQGKNNFFIYSKDGRTTNLRQNVRIESSAVIGGRLVFASKEGIHEVIGRRTVTLPGTELMRGRTVRAIMQDGKQMLLATADDGVFTYDGMTTRPYPMDITPILREGQIFCAAISAGYMAFGTVSSGLILKNRHTGVVTYANIYTGLQNNTVLSVAFDRQNNVWLGLDNGISYVTADAPLPRLARGPEQCRNGICLGRI